MYTFDSSWAKYLPVREDYLLSLAKTLTSTIWDTDRKRAQMALPSRPWNVLLPRRVTLNVSQSTLTETTSNGTHRTDFRQKNFNDESEIAKSDQVYMGDIIRPYKGNYKICSGNPHGGPLDVRNSLHTHTKNRNEYKINLPIWVVYIVGEWSLFYIKGNHRKLRQLLWSQSTKWKREIGEWRELLWRFHHGKERRIGLFVVDMSMKCIHDWFRRNLRHNFNINRIKSTHPRWIRYVIIYNVRSCSSNDSRRYIPYKYIET